MAEINRIAKSSSFNEINLLDGSHSSLTLQIGTNSSVALNTLSIGTPLSRSTSSSLGIQQSVLNAAFNSAAAAASFISVIDTAISSVSTKRADIGSLENRLQSAIQSLATKDQNISAAESAIRDVDVAQESANLTKEQILQQASVALQAQANQAPSIALKLIQ